MSEPLKEFAQLAELAKVPKEERQRRFRQSADGIRLQNPEQFRDLNIDYNRPALEFLSELDRLIKKGTSDVVVLVQPGLRGGLESIKNLDPAKTEVLLGRRLPGRIYENSWAPIMGRVQGKDLRDELVGELSLSELRNFSFGEFMGLIPTLREKGEELPFFSITPSTILAKPYFGKVTRRRVHVLISSYTEIPELLEKGDKRVGRKARRYKEHSEFRWFRLDSLPLDSMVDGTKKAMKSALTVIAEIQM